MWEVSKFSTEISTGFMLQTLPNLWLQYRQ